MSFYLPLGGSGVKEILLLMLLVPGRSDSHSELGGWNSVRVIYQFFSSEKMNQIYMDVHGHNNVNTGTYRSINCEIIYLGRLISEVESKLQVVEEVVSKLWVHVYHLQQIFSLNSAQVTVAQCSHISIRLSRPGKQMDHFSKDVIFS